MLKTTNFNRLFKGQIIASDLRKIDYHISKYINDSQKISDFVEFQITSKVKKKLYKDYVQNYSESAMLRDYSNF